MKIVLHFTNIPLTFNIFAIWRLKLNYSREHLLPTIPACTSVHIVSCMIWEGEEVKKIDLTILDLGWTIIERVNKLPEVCDYLMLSIAMVGMSMSLPVIFRIYHTRLHLAQLNYWRLPDVLQAAAILFGSNWRCVGPILSGYTHFIRGFY